MNDSPLAATPAVSSEPVVSPFARAIAVFARPANAWGGLREHAQWWFPVLVTLVVSVTLAALMYDHALLPMIRDQWDEQVAAGSMQPEAAERAAQFLEGTAGRAIVLGQQAIMLVIFTLVGGLLVWFGAGFVLGTGMKFRWALEVAAWSGLVTIPAGLITSALAWSQQSYRSVHVGFGILLPPNDPPNRWLTALGVVLDALGPLSIWYLIVGILGASALSGAPRKNVAFVLGGIYLAVTLFGAGIAAVMVPAS
jgi:hypothetical protein